MLLNALSEGTYISNISIFKIYEYIWPNSEGNANKDHKEIPFFF